MNRPAPAARAAAATPAFDHDLTCAVAVGAVDGGGTSATLEAVTTFDRATRTYQTREGWLNADDPLGALTRDCVRAKLKLSDTAPRPEQPAWERAKVVKLREAANADYLAVRGRVVSLLKTRDVFARARAAGMTVLVSDGTEAEPPLADELPSSGEVPVCPPMETMARFVLNQLGPAESKSILGHIAACERCAGMFSKDAPAKPTAPPAKTRAEEPPRRPPAATVASSSPARVAPGGAPEYPFLRPPERRDELARLGPYRILKELGAGGMGIVFRAEDTTLGRTVALKVMKPEFTADEKARARFTREARAVGAVEHENIVSVYQVGEDNGVPFMAMPFLKGETLADRLDREKKLPVPEVVRIGREILCGLAAAHAAGIVHRDIKPANVWLEGEKGRVKILDFGLARASDDTHLTRTGTVVGTPAYMSPEQASGKPVGPRSDLFSLGSVMYDMCAGKPPFDAPDEMAMMVAVATAKPRAITELNKAVPELLVRLIMRLLAKHVDDRPQTAKQALEMFDILGREMGPPPVDAQRPLPGAGKVMPKADDGTSVWPVVAAAALGLAAFAAYLFKDEWLKFVK